MKSVFSLRPVLKRDYDAWRPLWDGYNVFYGRNGQTGLPEEEVTLGTWERFLNPSEPVHAFVAEESGRLVGLVHYLFHRSTARIKDVCYLQDICTAERMRSLESPGS